MPYSYSQGRYVHEFPHPKKRGRDIVLTHGKDQRSTHFADIERNLMTYAPSRSGKGATQIIPNLLHWQHNALVIDPKGEAAEATAEKREAMGQAVHVLDPFETCNVPDRFRATLNPLDEIDPASPHAFRQINAIADGMVMRHNPESGFWDDGALKIIAGFLAHALSAKGVERRNMITMREWLQEPDPETFGALIDEMGRNKACGSLPIGASGKLTKTGSEAGHFLSGATSNTDWLNDPFMQACLAESSFKLSELKRKPMTIFLVLPFDALADYGRFLRLFVRMALYHIMQKMPDGSLKGKRCLFILDEFFSLGHIAEIQKAVGGLPGFNLHLWPFLQDANQLQELYGQHGAGTFTANADMSFFYGINDPVTAQLVADSAGRIRESDLKISPPPRPSEPTAPQQYRGWFSFLCKIETPEYQQWKKGRVQPVQSQAEPRLHINGGANSKRIDQVATAQASHSKSRKFEREMSEYQQNNASLMAQRHAKEATYTDEMNRYHHAQQTIGHPRVALDDVYKITAKNDDRKVSDYALALAGGVCYKVPLKAYFEQEG